MKELHLKKLFLYSLIGSVSLSALIGIVVILIGNFGEFEGRVLATTGTIAVTSILGLACGAYIETQRGRILPTVGIAFSVASALMFMFLIWGNRYFDNDTFLKVLGTVTMLAVTCSHLSLVSIPKLDARFEWARTVIAVCDWILVGILNYIMWFEPHSDSDLIARIIAVLAIVITALTIVIPIFYKLSRVVPETDAIDAEIELLKARIAELEAKKLANEQTEK